MDSPRDLLQVREHPGQARDDTRHSVAKILPLRLTGTAWRFDASPSWFSVLGAGLTMSWLASLDRAAVEAHSLSLANRVRTELQLPQQDSAIISIPIANAADSLALAGIRAAVRAGAVRVGFHLYNTDADVDRLLDALVPMR